MDNYGSGYGDGLIFIVAALLLFIGNKITARWPSADRWIPLTAAIIFFAVFGAMIIRAH